MTFDVGDLPDTWLYPADVEPVGYRPGPAGCGCNPSHGQSCPACDGTEDEAREMRAMPRRERLALELHNLRCDPLWRELHGIPDHDDLKETA